MKKSILGILLNGVLSLATFGQVNRDYEDIAKQKIKSAIVYLEDGYYEELKFDKSGRLLSHSYGKFCKRLDQVDYDTLGNTIAQTSITLFTSYFTCDTANFDRREFDEFGRGILDVSIDKKSTTMFGEYARTETRVRTVYYGRNTSYPDSAEIITFHDSIYERRIEQYDYVIETGVARKNNTKIDSAFNFLPSGKAVLIEYYDDNFFVLSESYKTHFKDSIQKLFITTWILDSASIKNDGKMYSSNSVDKNSSLDPQWQYKINADGSIQFTIGSRTYTKMTWKLEWVNSELVLILDDNGKLDEMKFIFISETKMAYYQETNDFGTFIFYFHSE